MANNNSETENEKEMNEWLNSTETLLKSVDSHYIQSCSIPLVPEELKNSSNKEAYMPRVVSIGPRFKGTREDLLLMEEVKLRSMLSLLHRAGNEGDSKTFLRQCAEAMWKSDKQIRASYVYQPETKLEIKDLANIMLLDGCFLLELMISKVMDSQLPSRLNPPGPATHVLKDEDVLSDLILFENQIPIVVLHKLSQILFPEEFGERKINWKQRANKINNLVLSILGYSNQSSPSPCHINAPHVLDIVHFFFNSKRKVLGNHVVAVTDTAQKPMLTLKRCASRLRAAGVSIKLAEETSRNSCFGFLRNCFGGICIKFGNMIVTNKNPGDIPTKEVKGLDFYFKFRNGTLEISQLEITKTTKAKWCNVIAWEHHKNNWKRSYISATEYDINDEQQISKSSLNAKFTSSALIFDGLICCAADVKLLKEKNIIVDHLKMSNEELEKFFHTLALGLDRGVVDSQYVKMVDELNNYYQAFLIVQIFKIFCHLFNYRLESFVNFLKQNYNFVAAVLALLSVVQTVYAILAYHVQK